ncbi:CXADR-like membrane protein isoform X3 [Tachyglossus aculeatus]|uniref:CXADR-like membrane protein isoform X3 n=1 Tax=Tachyglossus aculeatus TaxID=9261 RepID=UPI0018F610B9|nr:CXADR-like membrane protein isoform X3 [Tachyglossus aculeatus]
MSLLSILFLVSSYAGMSGAHMEIKKVADEKVILPCHHQLGLQEQRSLDIEWLMKDTAGKPKVVISFSSGKVYDDLNEDQQGRVDFAANYLAGDASLKITSLKPSDESEYTCKVKNAGRYHWNYITLKVLDYDHPGRVLLQNLTLSASGVYQCTASNEAGKESCQAEVAVQYVQSVGMMAGAVAGMAAGALLVLLLVWLLIRKKDKKRHEEEERPNEIREDAEAPKARLVKPSSSSSGSRSSRSGSSSTRSTANSAFHSQRTPSADAVPPPGISTHPYSLVGLEATGAEPSKVHSTTLSKMSTPPGPTPSLSQPFQTV